MSTENMRAASVHRILSFVALFTAVVGAVVLLWKVADVVLLLTAGILLAVFWRSLARFLDRHTPLKRKWALAVVVLIFMLLVAAGLLFYVPLATDGIDRLAVELPRTLQSLSERLSHHDWGRKILSRLAETNTWSTFTTDAFSHIAGIFSTALGAITASLVIFIIGLYLAAEPATYTGGFVRLFPEPRRQRVREVLSALEHGLDWWLLGRIASMTVVGVLTWVGLIAIGLPFALTLAILAALLSFVPNVGPIASAVPAVLVGLAEGPYKALTVILVYILVQTAESYLITPLIQRQAVLLPPALVMTMQLIFGLLFGVLGLLVATPLTLILVIVVKMLYLEDTLGEKVELP